MAVEAILLKGLLNTDWDFDSETLQKFFRTTVQINVFEDHFYFPFCEKNIRMETIKLKSYHNKTRPKLMVAQNSKNKDEKKLEQSGFCISKGRANKILLT